jgi:GGDEF domain-containing protein
MLVVLVFGVFLVLAALLFLVFRAAHIRIGRRQQQLVETTRRDALTGLLNHGAIVANLAVALEHARAGGTELAGP